jgi:hypothetical protein
MLSVPILYFNIKIHIVCLHAMYFAIVFRSAKNQGQSRESTSKREAETIICKECTLFW